MEGDIEGENGAIRKGAIRKGAIAKGAVIKWGNN